MPIRICGIKIQGLLKNAKDLKIIKGILIGILQMANVIFISEPRWKMRMCVFLHSSTKTSLGSGQPVGKWHSWGFPGKMH